MTKSACVKISYDDLLDEMHEQVKKGQSSFAQGSPATEIQFLKAPVTSTNHQKRKSNFGPTGRLLQ